MNRICVSFLTALLAASLWSAENKIGSHVDTPAAAHKKAHWESPALNPVVLEWKKNIEPVFLVKNGKAEAGIVIPKNDIPYADLPFVHPVKHEIYRKNCSELAAEELQTMIRNSTGATLKIYREGEKLPPNLKTIRIKRAASPGDIPPEGFRISVDQQGVSIIGALPVLEKRTAIKGVYGEIYGVYDFLERFVGIRFYHQDQGGTVIPKQSDLMIPNVQYTDYPRMAQRYMYGWEEMKADQNADSVRFALRSRSGGHGIWGMMMQHTPLNLVKGGAPQALGKNGKPHFYNPPPQMPCLSSEKTLGTLMNAYENAIRKKDLESWHDSNGNPRDYSICSFGQFPFSPMDHVIECFCPACRTKTDRKAIFPAQSSRLYCDFISKAANRVKAAYPDGIFRILPYYNYTVPANNLNLPDNVYAQVCMMYGLSLIHDPFIRDTAKEWISGWKKATGRKVAIYDYPCWPLLEGAMFPPQYYNNLKTFFQEHQNDIAGYFNCGGFTPYSYPTHYVLFRLLWNPEFNAAEAIKEQNELLYGPAAPQMRKLLEAMTSIWEGPRTINRKSVVELGPYQAGTIPKKELYKSILSDRDIALWKIWLAESAKQTADHPEYLRNVNHFSARMSLIFMEREFLKKNASCEMIKVKKIAKKPVINGNLNDPAWKNAEKALFVKAMPAHDKNPSAKTELQLLRTEKGLLIGMYMKEPEMNSMQLEKTNIWAGSSVELFFEYAPGEIYQFVINPDGKISDQFRNRQKGRTRNCDGQEIKVGKGTDFWTLEMFLPFAALTADRPFSENQIWKFNAVRNRKIKGKIPETSRLRTAFSRNNFDPNAFGILEWVSEK